jgi:hypothetical protein
MRGNLTLRELLESLGCEPPEQLVDCEIGKVWAWSPPDERASPRYIAVSATLDPDHGTEVTIRITEDAAPSRRPGAG